MAIFKSFLLGDVRNSVDNLTMYGISGAYVVRSKRMKIRNPRTLAQQLQRAKMKLLVGLSGHFAPLLPFGFPDRKGNRTMYNAFVRCNMDAVEVNEQMEATINYDRLSFSDGTLTAPEFTVALNKDSGELTFTPKAEERANLWINKEDYCYAVLLEKGTNAFDVINLGQRKDQQAITYTLSAEWNTEQMVIYVFAVSKSRRTSPTVCLALV